MNRVIEWLQTLAVLGVLWALYRMAACAFPL